MTITIGNSEIRKDARQKTTGAARYTADLHVPGMLHAAVLRSAYDHARIERVDTCAAKALDGVRAVLTAADVPGANRFGAIIPDQPALADGVVLHLGQPVALVVAESEQAAGRAAAAIDVQYIPLPAVFDSKSALAEGAPQLHPGGNLCASFDVAEGDVDDAFRRADLVVEETFTTPRIAPAYLEPEACVAEYHAEEEALTVWVSSQKPFVDRKEIAGVLGLDEEKIRVRSAVIGGAFGGKEDSSVAVLAALAAWCAKAPVRLVNDRRASFLAHPKRHPADITLKVGVSAEGKLLALDAHALLDTGAFASYGPAVGGLFTEVVPGCYCIGAVRVQTQVVYTNSPMSGAMRGFGAPQAVFAIEAMMDRIAERLGIDALELRRRNIIHPHERTFTRVEMSDSARSLPVILEKLAAAREEMRAVPARAGKKAGVGVALSVQTMGLGTHIQDDSANRLEWLPDGSVRLALGAPDLGQGLATVAEQIAAEELGIPFAQVHASAVDTGDTPDGGVSCASRMTYLVGNSVRLAAQALIDALLEDAARRLGMPRAELQYRTGAVVTAAGKSYPAAEFASRIADEGASLQAVGVASFPYPPERTPQHLPIGMPHVMFAFGGHAARVEVDELTGKVEVTHYTAIHDVGRVINRAAAEGQVEGALSMGLGYALLEEVQRTPGGGWVDGFTDYRLATTAEMPPVLRVELLEIPEESGPFGAKGVGEMGVPPVAPAIVNAVAAATGVRVRKIPVRAEELVDMRREA